MPAGLIFSPSQGGLAFHLQGHTATKLNQEGHLPGSGRDCKGPLVLVTSFQPVVPSLPLLTSPDGEHTASWGRLLHPCLL